MAAVQREINWIVDNNGLLIGYYAVGTGTPVVLFPNASAIGYTAPFTGAVPRTGQSKFSDIVSVKDFGAKGDGVTDDTAAINAAIAACTSPNHNLFFPAGVYMISSTLNFGTVWASGEGVFWQSGTATVIRSNTANILMATTSGNLENIVVDGNALALWGVMFGSARCRCDTLEVIKCTEYGVIMNASQNGAFVNLNCRFNLHGLVLANGTRNCNFYNFTSSVETAPNGGAASSASSCIHFLIDTSNPHGFGLSASVTAGGNDRNNFFGGISETFNVQSLCTVTTANNSGFGGSTSGNNQFYGYEFDGGVSILSTDSTFSGALNFYDCYFSWENDSTAFSTGVGGEVNIYGRSSFSGGGNLPARGITQSNNALDNLFVDTNRLSAAVIGLTDFANLYLEGGQGSFVFNATTKSFTVTSGGASSFAGLATALAGPLAFGNTNAANSTTQSILPVVRVRFSIDSIVGASQINFQASKTSSPFRTTIQQLGVGQYELFYKFTANDQGFSWGFNGATSYVISNIKIDLGL